MAVRSIEKNARTFTIVLSDVHAKLNDITRIDFKRNTFFITFPQSLIIHKGPIRALRVLQ